MLLLQSNVKLYIHTYFIKITMTDILLVSFKDDLKNAYNIRIHNSL